MKATSLGLVRPFFRPAGVLLFLTAAAKIASTAGEARIMGAADPILHIQFRYLFWIVAVFEGIVAWCCLSEMRVALQAGLLAWLTTLFGIYRVGLALGHYKYCPCLGNLTDALHVRPQVANILMESILLYMLVGSYAISILCWRSKMTDQSIIIPQ
jgi:hypothetical protein